MKKITDKLVELGIWEIADDINNEELASEWKRKALSSIPLTLLLFDKVSENKINLELLNKNEITWDIKMVIGNLEGDRVLLWIFLVASILFLLFSLYQYITFKKNI